jgi:AraC family transcriptional regulator
MGQSGAHAYGKTFGQVFGLEEAPAIVTKVLRKAEIAVTEVRSEQPRVGVTDSLPREDAYIVGLQLLAVPHHQIFEDGLASTVCDVQAGQTVLYNLNRDPRAMIDTPFHSIHFFIPRAALNAIADEAGARRIGELTYRAGAGVTDATVLHLGRSMMSAFEHPERASRLFLDHVTFAVATHVAQTYGHLMPMTRPVRGGLAPWQSRRAKEILSANLDGSVPLKDIAQECGVSIGHFSRAFRASAGVAPHAWLLRHRVDRAKALLPNLAMSLSDVALACGFADQSHFTRVFTREVGNSPGAWRRCLKE